MHDIQIQSLLNEMIFIAFYRLQIRSLLNQMIFIVLQGKRCFLQISDRCIIFKSKVYWIKWLSSSCSQRCFLQISDRCMIFKSKVYWIKWFSSSCSAKGVSFKFSDSNGVLFFADLCNVLFFSFWRTSQLINQTF